jgi:hypothetical protein
MEARRLVRELPSIAEALKPLAIAGIKPGLASKTCFGRLTGVDRRS